MTPLLAIPQGGLLLGQTSGARISGPNISTAQIAQSGVPLLGGIFGLSAAVSQARALRVTARQVENAGIAEANTIGRQGRFAVGRGVAIAGASGFTVDGSASDVLADLAAEAETSAARARWSADREAERLRFEARQTKRAGVFGLVSSVFKTGAAFVAGG